MILRIVKMTFDPAKTDEFLKVFYNSQPLIAASAGCYGVKLMQDAEQSNIYYTHSIWESVDALNAYRDSDLFARTWAQTKPLFIAKPEAFSLKEV